MAFRGKIACHFPDRGNPNADVQSISFLPEGTDPSAISEITDMPKVKAVYAIPAGVTSVTINDLPNYLVWEYFDQLLAGNESVAIEYVPESNVTLQSIGIFTANQNSWANSKIKVMHESGFFVAAVDGDVVDGSSSELYGLTGYNRSTSATVTLYAGQKYYIVFQQGTDYYPAYYSGVAGNYKVYNNNTSASSTTIRTLGTGAGEFDPSKFRGVLTSSEGIVAFNEDDWFTWNGSTSTGMMVGKVYVRSAVGDGNHYTFVGIIGDPNNYHTMTKADLMTLMAKPYIPNKPAVVIWYVDGISGMTRGDIVAITTNFSTYDQIDFTRYSGEPIEYVKTAGLLMKLNESPNCMWVDGSFWYAEHFGDIFSLKSGYTSMVESLTPLTTLPSNPQNGEIYYIAQGVITGGSYVNCCYAYNNGSWDEISQMTWTNFIDEATLSTTLTDLGTNQQLMKQEIDTGLYSFFTNGTQTDKKYYLKINGQEV